NVEHSDYITDFYGTLKKLKPGFVLPNVDLVNLNKEVIPISDLIDRPSVLFFWSKSNKMHATNSHVKVKELKAQFPDLNFISVNVNAQQFGSWQRMLGQYNFDRTNEFMLKDPEIATKLLALYNIYKVILVDDDMTIIHPNTNLYRREMNKLLVKMSSTSL
ncbi:MAG: hypothetical protein HKO94_07395, partial [Flavobacteriaceae bacterium]|nr:hypothetical protein [Flavobacteriaceae bacterium]